VAVRVGTQIRGWSHLNQSPVTQHHNQVTVTDRTQSMRDHKHSAVGQLTLHNVVDDAIGFEVDASRCFVHHQHAAVAKQGTRKTQQLFLSCAEAVSSVRDGSIQLVG